MSTKLTPSLSIAVTLRKQFPTGVDSGMVTLYVASLNTGRPTFLLTLMSTVAVAVSEGYAVSQAITRS